MTDPEPQVQLTDAETITDHEEEVVVPPIEMIDAETETESVSYSTALVQV